MIIHYSPKFLEYGPPYETHPECPERLRSILDAIRRSGLKLETRDPLPATADKLLMVHTPEHIERVRTPGSTTDRETPVMESTFEIASLAAGAAIEAAHSAREGAFSFALVRPPGHHAARTHSSGFCYFNNIAVAMSELMASGSNKLAILDIDAHHGNGTQNIFYHNGAVFFVSLHQDPSTAYMGSGYTSENNSHIMNFPLSQGTGDREYLRALEVALTKIEAFLPEVLGISAGFDTFISDPLGELGISDTNTYHEIGLMINRLPCPKFTVLEGGYHIPELGSMLVNFLKAFDSSRQ